MEHPELHVKRFCMGPAEAAERWLACCGGMRQ